MAPRRTPQCCRSPLHSPLPAHTPRRPSVTGHAGKVAGGHSPHTPLSRLRACGRRVVVGGKGDVVAASACGHPPVTAAAVHCGVGSGGVNDAPPSPLEVRRPAVGRAPALSLPSCPPSSLPRSFPPSLPLLRLSLSSFLSACVFLIWSLVSLYLLLVSLASFCRFPASLRFVVRFFTRRAFPWEPPLRRLCCCGRAHRHATAPL